MIFGRSSFRIAYGSSSRSDYRLDGHLVKAKICEMLHILREIQIVAGKGAADIVILACAALRELLELPEQ